MVKRFDPAKNEKVLKRLSPIAQEDFDQVRSPNESAHAYAYLEGAIGRMPNPAYSEKMTVACLGQGLGMDVGSFLGELTTVISFSTKSFSLKEKLEIVKI